MGGPLAWWQSLPDRIAQIILGLVIGTLGRYGLSLSEGKRVTVSMILSDLLLQGVFGAIAVAITSAMDLTGQAAVFVGAMVALNGARIARLARDTFFDRAKDRAGVELSEAAKAAPGPAMVPAGKGLPDAICAQPGTPDDPMARAGTSLRSGFGALRRPPADMVDELEKLRTMRDRP